MVHTPILPKKINWIALQDALSLSDKKNVISNWNVFLNQIIHWWLNESLARNIVYSDFLSRFYNNNAALPLFVAPVDSHNNIWYNGTLSNNFDQESYKNIQWSLHHLWVSFQIYHLFSDHNVESLYNFDWNLNSSHRIGLRSDVVYYDISQAKVIPDHRISIVKVEKQIYTIRFFLNSNKETLLWDIYHPLYLFGCVALLVNPHDKRYKKVRDKEIILPITNKQVPIIPYEWVSIEWHGTRILVPAHNREDFQIAVELGLPIDVYAFDKYGNFSQEAKDFAHKPLKDFSDNVVKYIDDISNLEAKRIVSLEEYRDKSTWTLLFPILEKNIYIWLWYNTIEDENLISSINTYWDTSSLLKDIESDEFFCISNQDVSQPLITSLWGYFPNQFFENESSNLIQDILIDFFVFRVVKFPSKGDELISNLSSSYNGQILWKIFYDYRVNHTSKYYEDIQEIYDVLSRISSNDEISLEDIDIVLWYIDHNSFFLHTKNWYTLSQNFQYHYDNEYIGLSNLISWFKNSQIFSLFYTPDEHKYIKYFIYLYNYIYNKPLSLELFSISSSQELWPQWNLLQKNTSTDTLRLLLLQSVLIDHSDDKWASFSFDQYDRFIAKWWNLSRIIPVYKLSLSQLQKNIEDNSNQLHDYDRYFITKIHELYDEVVFLQSKNHISQVIHLIVSTLRYEISDLLLYVLKKQPSTMSDMVSAYVILFLNHLLYPLMPVSVLWFIEGSGYNLERDFFVRDMKSSIEKNYKCNLMLYIISQRYRQINDMDTITWFVLQANRDFLDYCKDNIKDFSDFIGQEYTINYLEESENRPDIISHKIFTIQWGFYEQEQKQQQTLPSLSILQWQLQYKQQLIQTMKNTIVRMRASWQNDKIAQFQLQIDTLLNDIADLEYQISKLKYF